MLTITPQELISAGRIAADAVRNELSDVIGYIGSEKMLRKLNSNNAQYIKESRKEEQRLRRRKAKLEKTLLILKHIYM